MVKMVLMVMLKIMTILMVMMLNMIHFLRFDKASPSPTGAENGILALKKGSKEGLQGDKKKAESRSIRVKNSFFVPKMPVICWIFPPQNLEVPLSPVKISHWTKLIKIFIQ